MQVSAAQIEFFGKLVAEKDFPPGTPDEDTLKQQFGQLNKKSASEWIDKAMKLPNKGVEDEKLVTAPF